MWLKLSFDCVGGYRNRYLVSLSAKARTRDDEKLTPFVQ
jgi:hypothetical protein